MQEKSTSLTMLLTGSRKASSEAKWSGSKLASLTGMLGCFGWVQAKVVRVEGGRPLDPGQLFGGPKIPVSMGLSIRWAQARLFQGDVWAPPSVEES